MNFLANSAPQKVSLRRLLHRNLAGVRDDRGLKNVHASSLTQEASNRVFCARSYCLSTMLKHPKQTQFLSTALAMTFQIGRDIETHIRDAMGDDLVGNWKCPSCNQLQEFMKRPKTCKVCGLRGDLLQYEEVRFVSAVSGISCGIDILFDEGTGKHRVVESKSIDKEECKKLVAPLVEHRIRTQLYLRIIAESDSPYKNRVWTDEAVILYTSKGGFGFADPEVKTWGFADDAFSPFKEYRVKRNDAAVEGYHQKAMIVQNWRKQYLDLPVGVSVELPPRICKTSLDTRARGCHVCKDCFGS